MDDFAPRHKYPENMKRLEEYCKKVKESGMHYGDYVAANPDKPRQPVKKRSFTRICNCGKKFEPRLLKDGITISAQARCNDCINEERIKQGKCKIGERTVVCEWCQKEIVGAVGTQKYHKECKKEMLRKKREEEREKKQSALAEV